MRETTRGIESDDDWKSLLLNCHVDPLEGYLHTVLLSREVLPFSVALALAYEYPYTLRLQEPELRQRLTYSSMYGIPLMVPADVGGIQIGESTPEEQWMTALQQWSACLMDVSWRGPHMLTPSPITGTLARSTISAIMMNESSWLQPECSQNVFYHGRAICGSLEFVSPWIVCSTPPCTYVATGEPDALDQYVDHIMQCHVTSSGSGYLERDNGDQYQDSTHWGLNSCF